MSDEPLSIEDVEVRRSRPSVALRIMLVAFLLFLASIAFGSFSSTFARLALVPGLIVAIIALFRWSRSRIGVLDESRGALRIENGAVQFGGERILDASSVASAWVAPTAEGAVVEVRSKSAFVFPTTIRVRSVEDARRIVRALGHDVDQRAAVATTRSPLAPYSSIGLALLAMFGPITRAAASAGISLPVLGSIYVASIGLWFLLCDLSRKVIVGRDGIFIRGLGRGGRFVAHRSIRAVAAKGTAVELELVDGSRVTLQLHRKVKNVSEAWAREVAAVVDRIERARASADESPSYDSKLLESEGRPVVEWVRSLRRGDTIATFRDQALDEDQLWRVLESSEVDERHRAAAAIALSPTLDESRRARMRVAAAASAEPKLRVAIEAAADDDEEQMSRALKKLEKR